MNQKGFQQNTENFFHSVDTPAKEQESENRKRSEEKLENSSVTPNYEIESLPNPSATILIDSAHPKDNKNSNDFNDANTDNNDFSKNQHQLEPRDPLMKHSIPKDEKPNMNPKQDRAQCILIMGNPGAGKSLICSAIVGRSVFQSGVSFGTGLTTKSQFEEIASAEYIGDTPGLSDIETQEQAAKEIENALKQNFAYRLFFVILLKAGRVAPEDAMTIRLIMQSLPLGTPYRLIINKLSEAVFQKISKNQEAQQQILTSLLGADCPSPEGILMLQEEEKLTDADCILPEQATIEKLRNFVHRADLWPIDAKDVHHIDITNYKKEVEMAKSKIQQLLESDNTHLIQKKIEEAEQRRDELYQQLQLECKKHEEELQRLPQETNLDSAPTMRLDFGQLMRDYSLQERQQKPYEPQLQEQKHHQYDQNQNQHHHQQLERNLRDTQLRMAHLRNSKRKRQPFLVNMFREFTGLLSYFFN